MNADKVILTRRSVRQFLSKQVEDDVLKQILIAGNSAPSALNNTNKVFIALEGDQVKKKINEAVKESVNEETRKRICSRSETGEFNFFYNAPVLIVVASSDKLYPEADCACAIENMYLRATDLGLASCWINQLTKTENKDVLRILKHLGLGDNDVVYGALALGYSDVEPSTMNKANKIIVVK